MRAMSSLILSLLIIMSFVIVKIDKDRIWLFAPNEYTDGSDKSCEAFVRELDLYRTYYREVHIVNRGWIPGKKLYN